MAAFTTHQKVITDYRDYLSSFLSIQDERIKTAVSEALNDNGFLPEPLIQFNPEFEKGQPLKQLVAEGRVHPDLPKVFEIYNFNKHPIEKIDLTFLTTCRK